MSTAIVNFTSRNVQGMFRRFSEASAFERLYRRKKVPRFWMKEPRCSMGNQIKPKCVTRININYVFINIWLLDLNFSLSTAHYCYKNV